MGPRVPPDRRAGRGRSGHADSRDTDLSGPVVQTPLSAATRDEKRGGRERGADPGDGGPTRGVRGVPGRPCAQPRGAVGPLCTPRPPWRRPKCFHVVSQGSFDYINYFCSSLRHFENVGGIRASGGRAAVRPTGRGGVAKARPPHTCLGQCGKGMKRVKKIKQKQNPTERPRRTLLQEWRTGPPFHARLLARHRPAAAARRASRGEPGRGAGASCPPRARRASRGRRAEGGTHRDTGTFLGARRGDVAWRGRCRAAGEAWTGKARRHSARRAGTRSVPGEGPRGTSRGARAACRGPRGPGSPGGRARLGLGGRKAVFPRDGTAQVAREQVRDFPAELGNLRLAGFVQAQPAGAQSAGRGRRDTVQPPGSGRQTGKVRVAGPRSWAQQAFESGR